jgi:hypothetical protein
VAAPVTVLGLSMTGCLVQCSSLLDHGAILDLALDVAGDPVAAKVRVAESYMDGAAVDAAAGYLAGLEFLALPRQGAERLRRYLDEERRRRQRADAPSR